MIAVIIVYTNLLRAVAEELAEERGKMPAGSEKHMPWGQVGCPGVSWVNYALNLGPQKYALGPSEFTKQTRGCSCMYNFLAQGLEMHTKPWVRARASKDYWEKMRPAGETKAGDYHLF